ncbi:WAT1-related protein At5g40230-like [Pistacia vera]|uniref:WAT1-related protein At5g40230-like n=1 Tax=Pistacia vera TaxID=55513 RepID=UPI0012634D1D|nr:WAT1-related protein At5g40230-like [Pistacia vera]
MDRRNLWKEILLFAAMVSLECSSVGLTVIYKEATLKGMSSYVFVTYSFAIATLVLLPFAFYFRSTSTVLPSGRFPFIFRICLLGLTGYFSLIFYSMSLAMILGFKGIAYSSPTLASAMSTLTPAFTFTLAVISRMEKLILRSAKTQAKIIGTIASISGALVVVLYEGPTVLSSSSTHPASLQFLLGSSLSSWVIGGLLLSVEYLLFSFWYIIQGFTGTSLTTVVHTWALHIKGPVYVTCFKPLSIAIAVVLCFIFLGDALYLGRVIGAVIISMGFYAVIWGKANEEINEDDSSFDDTNSKSKSPLLQSLRDVEDTQSSTESYTN